MASNAQSMKSGDQKQRFSANVFQGEVDLVKDGSGGGTTAGEKRVISDRQGQGARSTRRQDVMTGIRGMLGKRTDKG